MDVTFIINAAHAAVTQYDNNLTLNSGCHVGDNDYIFASSSGIMLMDRTATDSSISSKFRTGNMNFGTPQLKRIVEAFMEMKLPGSYVLRIIPVTQNQTVGYESTDKTNPIKTNMLKIGRGITANYFCIEFENLDGSPWELQTIDLIMNVQQRRINGSIVRSGSCKQPL